MVNIESVRFGVLIRQQILFRAAVCIIQPLQTKQGKSFMDGVLNLVVVLGYLFGVILLANYIERVRRPLSPARHTSPVYYGALPENLPASAPAAPLVLPQAALSMLLLGLVSLCGLYGLGVLWVAFFPPPEPTLAVPRAVGVAAFVLIASAVVPCLLFLLHAPSEEAFGQVLARLGNFEPQSAVHRSALVLALMMLAFSISDVMLAGGVEGVAAQLETQQIGYIETLGNLLLMLSAGLLGVGWLTRRGVGQVAQRLALRMPTRSDVVQGLGTALACVMLAMAFSVVLSLVLPPEVLEAQSAASSEITRALSASLGVAFVAAMSAALGEEVLFRGALQPVFGIVPTAVFFTLLHSQYSLTLSSVLIFGVGAIFGILKERQSTTSAIIAHFAYNFILLLLAYTAVQLEQSGLLPESIILGVQVILGL